MPVVIVADLIDDVDLLNELYHSSMRTKARIVREQSVDNSAVMEFLISDADSTNFLLKFPELRLQETFSASTEVEFDFSLLDRLQDDRIFWIVSFLDLLERNPQTISESDVYLNLHYLSTV